MKRLAFVLALAALLVVSAPAQAKRTYAEKKLGTSCATTTKAKGLTAVCKGGKVKALRRGSARRPDLTIRKLAPRRLLVTHATWPQQRPVRAQASHNCADNRGHLLWAGGNNYVFQGFATDVVVWWANEEQLDNFDLVNGGNFASGGNFAEVYADITAGMRDWMGLRHPAWNNTPPCSWSQGGDLSGATDNNAGRVGLLYWGDNGPDSRASLNLYCAIGDGGIADGRNEISAGQFHSGCPYSGVEAVTTTLVQSGRPIEGDISFNLWKDWCTEAGGWCSNSSPTRMSVRGATRHEIGHPLGIDHTCVDRTPPTYVDPTCSNNSMDAAPCYVGTSSCWPDWIGLGDRNFEQALYP